MGMKLDREEPHGHRGVVAEAVVATLGLIGRRPASSSTRSP